MKRQPQLLKLAFLLAVVHLFTFLPAQIVSRFDFNSTATIDVATLGPNGTSYNPNSAVTAGAVYITSGCGHGYGLDLAVPATTFNTDNLQITTHFRRTGNEGVGNFFLRGNFYFGFRGRRLTAHYEYNNGGTPVPVTLMADYFLPNTTFETYTFSYDNCTGVAQLLVGNTVVRAFDGPDNRSLYWTGAGDGFIAENVDNGCSARYGMDWIEIRGNLGGCLPLGVEFGELSAQLEGAGVDLSWTTLSEYNNDYFTLERSTDGIDFVPLFEIPGMGNSSEVQTYAAHDPAPPQGTVYYRIRQTDLNGSESWSNVTTLEHALFEDRINVFPNPSQGMVQVQLSTASVGNRTLNLINMKGQNVFSETFSPAISPVKKSYDFSHLPAGMYLVRVNSGAGGQSIRLVLQ